MSRPKRGFGTLLVLTLLCLVLAVGNCREPGSQQLPMPTTTPVDENQVDDLAVALDVCQSEVADLRRQMETLTPLLDNGGFEADWGEESSHRVLIFYPDGNVEDTVRGNIFTPVSWISWFYHDPGTYDQPEVRDSRNRDPDRMHSGEKGILMFSFFRRHDGGFLQQVQVEPGQQLHFSAWASAWSNWQDGPHPDDPRWSDHEHDGYGAWCWPEGLPGLGGGDRNFTFRVGIDPTGGMNPLADSVVWEGVHAYGGWHGGFCNVEVRATAEAETVTVFLRATTLWAFKHNDSYFDDAELTVNWTIYLPFVER